MFDKVKIKNKKKQIQEKNVTKPKRKTFLFKRWKNEPFFRMAYLANDPQKFFNSSVEVIFKETF